MPVTGKKIVSTLEADGTLTTELVESEFPEPKGAQILVRVDAAPINPSDLFLLFNRGDIDGAEYTANKIVCKVPAAVVTASKGRIGQTLPVGNEGAGTVIAAGDDPAAQALLNRRVTYFSGSTFATHTIVDVANCHPLPDDVSSEDGAATFINPVTVLGLLETAKAEGHKALIHLAAASNLGRMLNRLCIEDNYPIINVVRSQQQVDTLVADGAKIVLNSTDADFEKKLEAAIAATDAFIGFDPIGGGPLTDTCLRAMEAVAASRMTTYSRYGSSQQKTMYIYGALDMAPTPLTRSYGFVWKVGGWLVTTFLFSSPEGTIQRLWARVVGSVKTIFKSEYTARITLEDVLRKDTIKAYTQLKTGEKYLVVMKE